MSKSIGSDKPIVRPRVKLVIKKGGKEDKKEVEEAEKEVKDVKKEVKKGGRRKTHKFKGREHFIVNILYRFLYKGESAEFISKDFASLGFSVSPSVIRYYGQKYREDYYRIYDYCVIEKNLRSEEDIEKCIKRNLLELVRASYDKRARRRKRVRKKEITKEVGMKS